MAEKTASHKSSFENAEGEQSGQKPALTPQQQRFRSKGFKALYTYRNLMLADAGWLPLFAFECYQLLLQGLAGMPGMALRALCLRAFAASYGKGSVIGRDVLIRQPSRLHIGKGVIVDDSAVLDIRDSKTQEQVPGIVLGDNTFIGRGSALVAKGAEIHLAEACNIGSHCRIASETKVHIGKSTLVAAYVYIGPGNHVRDESSGRVLVEAEMEKRGGVEIGEGCWIGTRATILDGVRIGKNAIVGAHSLVKDDVPDGAVVAGTPAKILQKAA